ncbi:hypothetical protein GCM10011531_26230 [Aquaticitalea lipolytica]|uniref:Uncharacterized protein n=1 Tax=Aquaticitalea lipolytica TaxID=1247562 RepID=A0A8J2XI54_9FLAO|nr:hypothetical protein GCM10011531_26230 [Aquaticitalea lipolytica]
MPCNQQNKIIMTRFIKVSVFVIVLTAITVYSKTIQYEIIENYNSCIEFMASNVQVPNGF